MTKNSMFFTYLVSRVKYASYFCKAVFYQAREGVALMEPNHPYMAKDICGDGFWMLLTNFERRLAGWYLARMASKNMLPIRIIGKRGNTLVYQLI